MRKIEKIILHKSASDNPAHDNIATIDQWHREKGWQGVGYHYFIRFDGTIEKGRSIDIMGSHCFGHNSTSIGVCMHGNLRFSNAQFEALRCLISDIKLEYGNDITVHGHCEFNDTKKDCPGFDYKKILGL